MVATGLIFIILLIVYLACLITAIVVAVTAETKGARVTAIITSCLLFFGVPLFLLMVGLVAYQSTSEREPATITYSSDMESFPERPAPLPQMPGLETGGLAKASRESSQPDLPPVPPPVIGPAESNSDGELSVTSEWNSSATHAFDANVYPDFRSAALCLVEALPDALKEQRFLPQDEDGKNAPERIMLTGLGSKVAVLLPEISQSLGKHFDGTEIEISGKIERQPRDKYLTVHFETDGGRQYLALWDQKQSVEDTNLICRVQSVDRDITLRAFVTEKPWVESFDRFVSLNPTRNFIVGYSGDLQSSEFEAREAAVEDAKRKVTRSFGGAAYSMIDGRHVVDRFAQRLSRPYGNVWREAVLVEVPSEDQMEIASITVSRRVDAIEREQIRSYLGLAVLGIVTVFLCTLLNWLTEGYYRGRVLVGLAGLAVLGCVVVVLFVA